MSFVDKLRNLTLTENGAVALKSTLNSSLDLFYTIGASRGKDIIPLFKLSYKEFPELSVRITLWARDTAGCGERQLFKNILQYIESEDIELFKRIAVKVPNLGRWDDLLCAQTPQGFEFISQLIKKDIDEAVEKGTYRSLAAKWMPRKGEIAEKLRKAFKMTPKEYRKYLVMNTVVVESQMCENKFNEIEFKEVPSLAMARYSNAFNRKAKERFDQYKKDLEDKKIKAKTKSLYPYDVLKNLKSGDEQMAISQWRDLPDLMVGCRILPMVDVSGSMETRVSGSTTAMDVSISMGIYISEKQKGDFKDLLLTFHETPSFINLKKLTGLKEKYLETEKAPWGGTTNIKAAFSLLLDMAVKHKITQEEMPEVLMVFSDMEFDYACPDKSDTIFETCKKMYEKKGFKLPTVVFWNLVSRNKHVPVEFKTNGTVLLSGLSPFILKNVLNDLTNLDAMEIMKKIISDERYDF